MIVLQFELATPSLKSGPDTVELDLTIGRVTQEPSNASDPRLSLPRFAQY